MKTKTSVVFIFWFSILPSVFKLSRLASFQLCSHGRSINRATQEDYSVTHILQPDAEGHKSVCFHLEALQHMCSHKTKEDSERECQDKNGFNSCSISQVGIGLSALHRIGPCFSFVFLYLR